MQITSIVAIYFLFWVLSAFVLLPGAYVKSTRDDPDFVEGQAESAPRHFDPWRIVRRATVLSAVLMLVFYLNYVNGWITIDQLDISRMVDRN